MIPFLDKTIVKITLIAVLFAAIFGAYKWHYNSVFQAGVNHQIAKQKEADDKADKEYTEELSTALTESKAAKEEAAKLQTEIDNIKRKYKDVSKAASNSECKHIGDESFQLLNDIIGEPPSY